MSDLDHPTTALIGLSDGQRERGLAPRRRNYRFGALAAGPLLALAVYLVMPADLDHAARATAAVAVLLGAWWITECIPIPATALIPLVVFPMLGIQSLKDTAPSYANSTIMLFMGGFLLALAMEHWNLHKRIALHIVLLIGTRPTRLVAGFMIATALLSMWVSNTATAMMMIPMGMAVVKLVHADTSDEERSRSRFGVALMLGIAYSATIGGFGTMIGSPVNVIAVGYLRETLKIDLTFLDWMLIGVPVMVVLLGVGWVLLTKLVWKPEVDDLPGGRTLFESQLQSMGRMSSGEIAIAVLFGTTALAWILTPVIWPGSWATDATIAMLAGVATFLIPARPREGIQLLSWGVAKRLPIDVLMLFGGGLALSSAITSSGLATWIGAQMGTLSALPIWLLILIVVAVITFLTEFTSSTATTAAFVPVVGGVAGGIGADPAMFVLAAAFAAMCAFMLPVGTPPNAIAFGSGAVTMQQMVKTGIWFNLVGIALVVVALLVLVPLVLR